MTCHALKHMLAVSDISLEACLAAFEFAFDASDHGSSGSVERLDADTAFSGWGLFDLHDCRVVDESIRGGCIYCITIINFDRF
jgi:hypothetical protein